MITRNDFRLAAVVLAATLALAGCNQVEPDSKAAPVDTSTARAQLPAPTTVVSAPISASNKINAAFDPRYLESNIAFFEKKFDVIPFRSVKYTRSDEKNIDARKYEMGACYLDVEVESKTGNILSIGITLVDRVSEKTECTVENRELSSAELTFRKVVSEGPPERVDLMLDPGNVEEAWWGSIIFDPTHAGGFVRRTYTFESSDGMNDWRRLILDSNGVDGDGDKGYDLLQANMSEYVQSAIETWGNPAVVEVKIER